MRDTEVPSTRLELDQAHEIARLKDALNAADNEKARLREWVAFFRGESDPAVVFTFLTGAERALITKLGECMTAFKDIAGTDHDADLDEVCDKIHQLQHTVMAQAAARAYPEDYRLLGVVPW